MKSFNFLFLSGVLSLCILQAKAQHTGTCGTDHIVQEEIQNNPHAAYEMQKIFNEALQQYEANPQKSGQRAVLTIPVVFHIVLNTQQKMNVASDAEVLAQLETLNTDMRKMNGDTTDIRSIFQPVAADVEIEFCLAQTDPQGNPTNGIDRFMTTVAEFPVDDDMKFANSGGTNSWDSEKYLNVWVVDLASGSGGSSTAGFAYFPNQHGSSIDGIVLDYWIGFGATDRSLTHEVGHYLGLSHTWGGGGCNSDDGIDDTPPTDDLTFGCSFTRNTCSNDNPDLPDQVENYMDYSSCPRMWTVIQAAVMKNVLTGTRSSLLGSDACLPPNSPPLVSFEPEEDFVCPGSSVQFFDFSQGNPTGWSWSFPGGIPSTSTQQNPVVTYPNTGTYDVTLTASNGNGSDDLTLMTAITVNVGGVANIFSEDFESGFSGWQVENPDGSNSWNIATVNGNNPGSNAAKMSLWQYGATGQRDGLVSPTFDLTTNTDVVLTFDYAHRRRSQNFSDSLLVLVSTDGGSSYPYKVYGAAESGGGTFATGFLLNSPFIPNDEDDWCGTSATGADCIEVDLSQFDGESNVRIKFETVNDNGNNIYIDNVNVSGTCTVVAGQGPLANFTSDITTVCGGGQVHFLDASFNAPTSWSWSFPGGVPSTSFLEQNPFVTYGSDGVYAVTLTVTNNDGSNTTSQSSYIQVVQSPVIDMVKSTPATCAGIDDGSIDTVNISGGLPPYTYYWDFGPIVALADNVPAGTNVLTVTDANGCAVSQNVMVDAGMTLSLVSITNPDSAGVGRGSISVVATGGQSPYTYAWNDANNTTTSSIKNLTLGSYTVTAVDVNGCEIAQTFFVTDIDNPNTGIEDVSVFNEILLYPNPTTGILKLDVVLDRPEKVAVTVFNTVGKQIFLQNIEQQTQMNLQYDLSTYAPGIYYVKVQTEQESKVQRFILLQ